MPGFFIFELECQNLRIKDKLMLGSELPVLLQVHLLYNVDQNFCGLP